MRLLSVAMLVRSVGGVMQGAIKLDNYTFDKALSVPGFSWLVKFDKAHAFGDEADEFKALCELAYTIPKFFIAEVPVQEYDNHENYHLADAWGVNGGRGKAHFPAYYLFNDAYPHKVGGGGGLMYRSGTLMHNAHDIALWLRNNKVKFPHTGTIYEIDLIVRRYMKGGAKNKNDVNDIKKLATTKYKDKAIATYYIKILDKIQENGVEYIEKETQRMKKVMDNKLEPDQRAELHDKYKVLLLFGDTDAHHWPHVPPRKFHEDML